MGKLSEYLEHHGIAKRDIPGAFLLMKGMGYGMFIGTWGLCYRFKPLRKFAKTSTGTWIRSGIKSRFPNQYDWTKQSITKSSQGLTESRFFKPIPRVLGLKAKETSISLAENILFYKLLFPLILPLQFFTAVHIYGSKPTDHGILDILDDYSNAEDDTPDLSELIELNYPDQDSNDK